MQSPSARLFTSPRVGWRQQAFTIVEVAVGAALLSVILGGVFALTSRSYSVLRAGREESSAAIAFEYRLEQMRRAPWPEVTSESVAPEDDGGADDVDLEDDGTPMESDEETPSPSDPVYSTEFPDDLADLALSTPGVASILAVPSPVENSLRALSEQITVAPWPPRPVTPIRVERANGVVTILSHNADMCDEKAVTVVVRTAWKSADNRDRAWEVITVIAHGLQ